VIDKAYIDCLKILHGFYNTVIAVFFAYHAALGLRIRRERRAGSKRDFQTIRRHRTAGPLLTFFGILGYGAGAGAVYIDKGRLLEYPLHLMAGSCLALLIFAGYLTSRKIKGPDSSWRIPHFIIGIFILLLYVIQIVMGLNILL
jgi:hypothetical protein